VITASASDSVGVVGYCFKNNSSVPTATDACFQLSNQQSITPTLPRLPYYVWAKDAASNVSAALQVDPCSAAGAAASPILACDATAPVMTGLSTTFAAATGVITLTATSTENVGGSGGVQYCFKTSSTTPVATNACFQVSNKMSVVPALPLLPFYVWAKDAAGNVSTLPLSGPCSQAGFASSAASTLPTVCMMTDKGEMVFELENTKAPITVANFLQYVRTGFYTNTVFHRVMPSFMVQGGGFNYVAGTNQLVAKAPTYSAIALETPATTGLSNAVIGSIAMARTSQFFVNVVDNTTLNTAGGGYAVFGKLISGTSTLTTLKLVPIVSNGSELSLPTTPPIIEWALQLK
jgi:cyclophilin family peptidyl-prolyl cis-trans isomerase